MRTSIKLIALLGFVFSVGCQADAREVVIPTDVEIVTPDRINPTVTKIPERVPPTSETPSVTGEVPTELLNTIVLDLSVRTGVAPELIGVIQDQVIVWNDGSLGCAQPGEFYTQALVNGYWVILEAEGNKYDYRAAASGYFFLCERGIPPLTPSGTPSS